MKTGTVVSKASIHKQIFVGEIIRLLLESLVSLKLGSVLATMLSFSHLSEGVF